jgi:hypothetical protein
VGAPDANRLPSKAVGSVRAYVAAGDPATIEDEADLRLLAGMTDVRTRIDLSDYTGELEIDLPLRITDADSASASGAGAGPATMEDIHFSFAMPCTQTPDSTIGGSCAVATTADTLVPGSANEGQRAVWEVGQVRVLDGGARGTAAAGDSELFAVQGVFTP